MNILLLNPSFGPDFCKSARWFARSRGRVQRHPDFLCEATALLEAHGHDCALIDAAAGNLGAEETAQHIRRIRPQLTLIQATTPSIDSDISWARQAKELTGGRSRTVLVGAHVTAEPEDTLRRGRGAVDAVARGEYDLTLKELADGSDFGSILGLAYLSADTFVATAPRPFIEDLDTLPFPAWRHIDPRTYRDGTKRHPFITLLGSRGCLGTCTFCLLPQTMYGRRARTKSPQRIIDEIRYDLGLFPFLKEIMFEDDTFVSAANAGRLESICRLLEKERIRIPWSANARADLLDRALLERLKKCGCRMLCVGYEFGAQEMLDAAGKNIPLSTMREFSAWAAEAGIRLHGCFMFGGPGENERTCRQTLEFAKELPLETAQFSGIAAYPGTAYYRWSKEKGYLCARDWSDWVRADGEQATVLQFPGLPKEEINRWINRSLREFYLRPAQLARLAGASLRSWNDFETRLYGLRQLLAGEALKR